MCPPKLKQSKLSVLSKAQEVLDPCNGRQHAAFEPTQWSDIAPVKIQCVHWSSLPQILISNIMNGWLVGKYHTKVDFLRSFGYLRENLYKNQDN